MTNTCNCGRPARSTKELCTACYGRIWRRKRAEAGRRGPNTTSGFIGPKAPKGALRRTATPCKYLAALHRVENTRGKAKTYQCARCTEPAAEWRYMGGSEFEQSAEMVKFANSKHEHIGIMAWSGYVWDYKPLCHVCKVS